MSFFRTIAGGIAVHILMKYCFPQQYDMLFITSFTKTIYLYSFLELFLKKQIKKTDEYPLIKNMLTLFKKTHQEIEVIKFNEPCFAMSLDEYKNWIKIRLDYDFIIYSHKESEESTMYNRVLFESIGKPIDDVVSYKLCSFSFISIQVSIEDLVDRSKTNHYYLKFMTDDENYYIVGNKINHEVVLYLLKTQCNVDYPPFTTYIVDVIDFNVNLQFLTEKDTIHFLENDYKVTHDEVNLSLEIPERSEIDSSSDSDSDLDDLPDLIEMEFVDEPAEYKTYSYEEDSSLLVEFINTPTTVLSEEKLEPSEKKEEEEKEIGMEIELDIDAEIKEIKQMMESEDTKSPPTQIPRQKRKYNKRKIA